MCTLDLSIDDFLISQQLYQFETISSRCFALLASDRHTFTSIHSALSGIFTNTSLSRIFCDGSRRAGDSSLGSKKGTNTGGILLIHYPVTLEWVNTVNFPFMLSSSFVISFYFRKICLRWIHKVYWKNGSSRITLHMKWSMQYIRLNWYGIYLILLIFSVQITWKMNTTMFEQIKRPSVQFRNALNEMNDIIFMLWYVRFCCHLLSLRYLYVEHGIKKAGQSCELTIRHLPGCKLWFD